MERPETGPMQFGKDWPGVFIRGDEAFHFFLHLQEARRQFKLTAPATMDLRIIDSVLAGLEDCLKSCRVMPGQTAPEAPVQVLKPIKECLP